MVPTTWLPSHQLNIILIIIFFLIMKKNVVDCDQGLASQRISFFLLFLLLFSLSLLSLPFAVLSPSLSLSSSFSCLPSFLHVSFSSLVYFFVFSVIIFSPLSLFHSLFSCVFFLHSFSSSLPSSPFHLRNIYIYTLFSLFFLSLSISFAFTLSILFPPPLSIGGGEGVEGVLGRGRDKEEEEEEEEKEEEETGEGGG